MLSAALACGIFLSHTHVVFSTPLDFSLTLPAASLDLSDLDVRDENNRQIVDKIEIAKLRTLFETGLNALLMNNLTPFTRYVQNLMSRSWSVFSGVVGAAFHRVQAAVIAWLKQKRFEITLISTRGSSSTSSQGISLITSFAGSSSLVSSILSSTIILR